MTRSLLGRLRRLWLDVHLWLGVGLFVLTVPLGLSGAYLVWHDGFDRLTHPGRYAVSRSAEVVPASTLLDAARAALGQRATPTQLRLPEDEGGPATVQGRVPGPVAAGARPKTLTAFLDPATGKVLEVVDTEASFTRIMHRLHGQLLVTTPGLGRKIVGWLGWAMTVSCLTGLWLWWPRNGRVLKALRWRRSPSTWNNLHHMVGFWVLVPLLILSLTGVYISFPQTARALFGVAPPAAQRGGMPGMGGPRRTPPPPLAETRLTIDEAVQAAQAETPGVLTAVTLPTKGKAPAWRVALKVDGLDAPVTVRVDDASGEVRQGGGPDGPAAQDPLSRWMRRLHDGDDMGPVWQALIFLAGLAPALLGTSGTIMWLHRRHLRKAIRHGHDAGHDTAATS
ncbi:putative iron-regulated membrane protein [Caulobacter ginsengisoli]|uniref:Iron-regulated membrane protein n=1 Tax=Caulobacter ginsengisoli TaxID=400775 RepID=A0ABU0ITT1_9CAUL|nr:PepSY-associated TM helix domain-containing protein [Caulobacter ginsengisoli]MDQ0465411.1 putative iron-regulated membrane protein [Caulobacter ginsengisoli]